MSAPFPADLGAPGDLAGGTDIFSVLDNQQLKDEVFARAMLNLEPSQPSGGQPGWMASDHSSLVSIIATCVLDANLPE